MASCFSEVWKTWKTTAMESMLESGLSNKEGVSKKRMTQCAICYRKASKEYCSLHEIACKNIVQVYEKWRSSKALTWKDYLRSVKNNSNSGLWVVEVCEYLLSKEERQLNV